MERRRSWLVFLVSCFLLVATIAGTVISGPVSVNPTTVSSTAPELKGTVSEPLADASGPVLVPRSNVHKAWWKKWLSERKKRTSQPLWRPGMYTLLSEKTKITPKKIQVKV